MGAAMSTDHSKLIAKLIKPDGPFKRCDNTAYLYIFYSRRNRQRMYVYRPRMEALCVHLECEPQVQAYNPRVPAVAVSLGGGAVAANVSPPAVSVDHDGALTVHTFLRIGTGEANDNEDEDAPSEQPSWGLWCAAHGFRHVEWTREALWSNSTLHNNRKKLLRFVSRSGWLPDPLSMDAALGALRTRPKTTFYDLTQRLSTGDVEPVQRSIAALILDGRIFSTIASEPFSMATELSAFHEL